MIRFPCMLIELCCGFTIAQIGRFNEVDRADPMTLWANDDDDVTSWAVRLFGVS